MTKESKYFRLSDYFDVWGNPRDGFEVNNMCYRFFKAPAGILDSRKSCLQALKRIGFLKKSVRENSISWEEMDSGYILADRKGYPVCALEEIPQGEFEFYVRDSEIPDWELV